MPTPAEIQQLPSYALYPVEGDLPKPNTFEKALDKFSLALNSLADSVPLSLGTVSMAYSRAHRQLTDFIKPYIVHSERFESFETHRLNIPASKATRVKQLQLRANRLDHAVRAISESALVALVTQFDTFVGSLARALLGARLEILNTSDRVLTFSELQTFSSIEEARAFIIDKEVDQLLRKSHKEQVDWFEKRLKRGTSLQAALGPWREFVETTERRNVMIHADALVSNQYREECVKNGFPEAEVATFGERLEVSPDYFKLAYATLYEVGIRLGYTLWLTVERNDREPILTSLNNLALELLSEDKSALASRVLLFAKDRCDGSESELLRKMLTMNLAQAYKWKGDQVKLDDLLSSQDLTASDDSFRLATAVLKGDWDATEHYMKRLKRAGDIRPSSYREWPLFKQLRKDDRFINLFKSLYSEPLEEPQGDLSLSISEVLAGEEKTKQQLVRSGKAVKVRSSAAKPKLPMKVTAHTKAPRKASSPKRTS